MESTKLVKPASPTPSHLRTLKLSPLDRQFSFMSKPYGLYYYSGGDSDQDVERRRRIEQLETSLSEILTRYYPLAGIYMKDTQLIVKMKGLSIWRPKWKGSNSVNFSIDEMR